MAGLQLILGLVVITVSLSCLYRFHSAGYFLHNEDICRTIYTIKEVKNSEGFDLKALHDRVDDVLEKMDYLYDKLEKTVKEMEKSKDGSKREIKRFLEDEVMKPFYHAHIGLRQIRLPNPEGIRNSTEKEEPLINKFLTEEIRKYITPRRIVLGRRRCLTRASMTYQKPYPINESLWKLPDDRNVRWGNYLCRNFACLSSKTLKGLHQMHWMF
ncbi:hypothetical protein Bca52824_067597 [Brassica carinata]|uniref:Uncharacterized protein n=1 Tax=Brassica carinata TaxID=52824 RepID=A0A8X7QNZ2_BRACI|nr:hypothetical protein Bca52824_067597 [Brassica carinata]